MEWYKIQGTLLVHQSKKIWWLLHSFDLKSQSVYELLYRNGKFISNLKDKRKWDIKDKYQFLLQTQNFIKSHCIVYTWQSVLLSSVLSSSVWPWYNDRQFTKNNRNNSIYAKTNHLFFMLWSSYLNYLMMLLINQVNAIYCELCLRSIDL